MNGYKSLILVLIVKLKRLHGQNYSISSILTRLYIISYMENC